MTEILQRFDGVDKLALVEQIEVHTVRRLIWDQRRQSAATLEDPCCDSVGVLEDAHKQPVLGELASQLVAGVTACLVHGDEPIR